jgi:hypothetical protein
MSPSIHDRETQVAGVELEQVPKETASRSSQPSLEPAELENAPLIIKSVVDSSLWAQERCSRRIGLTANEAHEVLSFLVTIRDMANALDHFNPGELIVIGDQLIEAQKKIMSFLDYLDSLNAIFDAVSNALKVVRSNGWWNLGSRSRVQFLATRRKQILDLMELSLLIMPLSNEFVQIDPRMEMIQSPSATANENGSPLPSMETTDKTENTKKTAWKVRVSELISKPLDGVNSILTLSQKEYLVVGWFSRGSTDPKEQILEFEDTAMFKELRSTIRGIRGWHEYISLKSLSGFGLYTVSDSKPPSSLSLIIVV